MEEINNLVKGTKQKDIYAILDKFISDLKKEKDSIKTGDITFKGILEDNKPKDIGILKHKSIGEFEGSFFGDFHKGKGKLSIMMVALTKENGKIIKGKKKEFNLS